MMIPWTSRIQSKLMLAMLLLNSILTVAFTQRLYAVQKQSIMEGVDRQLRSAVQGISFVLPDNFHGQWMQTDSIPDSLYRVYSLRLDSFAIDNGVAYLYSFMMDAQDSVRFIVSSNTSGQLDTGKHVRFRDVYPEATPVLLQAFAQDSMFYEISGDSYGNWRSALVRKTTPGGAYYVLGADVEISHINALLHRSLVHGLLIGIGVFCFFCFITYRLAKSISTPLVRLESQTHTLVSQHFDLVHFDRSILEGIYHRVRDESGRLAHAFLLMLDNLQSHMQKLERETALRNRIENEMNLAAEIQRSYFPRQDTIPLPPHLHVVGYSKPARNAGGDLYDYFWLDDHRLFFALGDVSDKGMPAALFMAISVTLLREAAQNHRAEGLNLSQLVASVNQSLNRNNDLCQFVTLFTGVLDLRSGIVDFVNAGHNPPLLLDATGGVTWIRDKHGPALGVLEGIVYRQGQMQLPPGSTLVLYTDGITEAWNTADEQFGEGRLLQFLHNKQEVLPSDLLEQLWKSLDQFVGEAEQSDDITALVLHRLR